MLFSTVRAYLATIEKKGKIRVEKKSFFKLAAVAFIALLLQPVADCQGADTSGGKGGIIGNPRFVALYMPKVKGQSDRNSGVVRSVGRCIEGVFVKEGFIVLDEKSLDDIYGEIELAGMIDTDVDGLSALALKYRADLLLLYDVAVSKKQGGKSRFFGSLNVGVNLRTVSPSTGDVVAIKSGNVEIRTKKDSVQYYEDKAVGGASVKVATAASEALIKDVRDWYSKPVRYDIWFQDFSEDELYTVVDIIENLEDCQGFDVRNQTPENFQLDVFYKGKKFNLQRQLHKKLQEHDITFSTGQSKGNRLLLIRE